ncbi:MAG: MATE family efflux transporter [Deltaproteobacteria bacterium]|nr:MATE family efflux transporter [Deltaproteobacteria bacterium]MBK8239938.1 MATE family efflux transporter [Deltaproteobacteria bacterium]MBK8716077.1 MATE family efflux transporter [Deltaproteobacteria bacterium]MBP7286850.1 MATE family efflux transporter [Nannocystaceae bacterium]
MAARHDYATLLRLAWPVVLSRASQAVIGFSDAAMVASLGDEAIAATTTGASNSFNVFILPMGIAFIVQSFSAQLTGAGDAAGSRRFAWYGLGVALAAGLLTGLATLALPGTVALLGYTPAVQQLLVDYMAIRLTSCAAVIGIEALGAWYAGVGNTRLPMMVNLVAMVLNVGFNWVFIHGHLGSPALGVAGAAWASALASWCAFALVAFAFWRRIGVVAQGSRGPLRWSELARMLRFGLPNGINWFLEFAAFTFFVNVVVAELGTTAVAAFMAVVQVNSIAFMPAFGLASAGAILVGQAIGSDDRDAVPGLVRRTMVVAGGWQLFVGLVYALMPDRVMSIFARERASAELVEIGATMLLVSTAWQLFDAISITLSETLRAAGDTAWCMWARVVLAWVLFVPLAGLVVLRTGAGPVGAIACLVAYLAALALVLGWRFRSGAWRQIQLTEGQPAPG